MTLDQNTIELIASRALSVRARGQNDAENMPSPCVSVCRMDEASGLCQGCLRTLDEIRLWGKADDNFKRRVWADIEDRLAEYTV